MGMLMFSMCATCGGSGTVLAPAEAVFVPPGHAGRPLASDVGIVTTRSVPKYRVVHGKCTRYFGMFWILDGKYLQGRFGI